MVSNVRRHYEPTIWYIHEGKTPLVATAIHAGHEIRREVAEHLALSESDRLREEDPFTSELDNGSTESIDRFQVTIRDRCEPTEGKSLLHKT